MTIETGTHCRTAGQVIIVKSDDDKREVLPLLVAAEIVKENQTWSHNSGMWNGSANPDESSEEPIREFTLSELAQKKSSVRDTTIIMVDCDLPEGSLQADVAQAIYSVTTTEKWDSENAREECYCGAPFTGVGEGGPCACGQSYYPRPARIEKVVRL